MMYLTLQNNDNVVRCIVTTGHFCGDVVAEWIVHWTLNAQVVGLNLSAASLLTMCSAYMSVVPDLVEKTGMCAVMSL